MAISLLAQVPIAPDQHGVLIFHTWKDKVVLDQDGERFRHGQGLLPSVRQLRGESRSTRMEFLGDGGECVQGVSRLSFRKDIQECQGGRRRRKDQHRFFGQMGQNPC